jgi:hypothetical protein
MRNYDIYLAVVVGDSWKCLRPLLAEDYPPKVAQRLPIRLRGWFPPPTRILPSDQPFETQL